MRIPIFLTLSLALIGSAVWSAQEETKAAETEVAAEEEKTEIEKSAVPGQPELGWPRQFMREGYRLVAYQPQLSDWEDYRRIDARQAVLLTPPDAEEAVAGAVHLRAKTETHMEARTVFFHELEVVDVRFPDIEGTDLERITEIVRSVFPEKPVAVSLDRVLAGLDGSSVHSREVELKHAPPKIFVSESPAVLVNLDGKPAWVPTGVEHLKYAVNTNWDLFEFQKKANKPPQYFLRNGSSWMVAKTIEGPWSPAKKLPKPFKKLPLDDNFRDVRMNVPGEKISAADAARVFVSQEPAELILLEGEPEFSPVGSSSILVVDNTEVDLFRDIETKKYYFLIAGRWFSTDDLGSENWQPATEDLPAGFAEIPADHEKAHVLAAVPGTEAAETAVLEAQIPTVAEVSREDAPKEVEVKYVGEPEFKPIEDTKLEYAVNTSSDVIKAGDTYYLCQKGVWFTSKSAEGPWQVATEVPKEIYAIPASSPLHHTTYVYAYDSTPTTVTYGYTSGYTGMYISYGCVVWGTGWYYHPYYYYGPYYGYPIYYPYYYTYGAGAWYNPATGFYGAGHAYYGPYGGVARGAAYNPTTGTYARGGHAYGLGGAAAWGRAYNPRTGTGAAGYRGANAYSSWGQGVVRRGDDWLKGGYYSDARGDVKGFRTSDGRGAMVVDRGNGETKLARGKDNVYVGRDGEVYRRGQDGWEKYNGRDQGWGKVGDGLSPEQRDAVRDRAGSRPSTTGDLDRAAANRQAGTSRASRYSSWKSSGGWSGSSRGRSYSGGGRMRAGGGMRRR